MSMPLIAMAAPAPMPWLASCMRYMRFHRPTISPASCPMTSWRSVVLASCATAPGARAACASPQPVMPSSVTIFTITASRFTVRPIPSETFAPSGTLKEIG